MFFSLPKIFICLASGVALAALSAAAQQDIQETKPADSGNTSQGGSFMPPASERRNSADAFKATTSPFRIGAEESFDVLPGASSRTISPQDARRWQKILEGKKNWMLSTPEDILGVPTPEGILGISDPNNDEKLSLEARYLRRQERQSLAAATNNSVRLDDALRADRADPFRQPGAGDPFARPGANSDRVSAAYFNRPQNASDGSLFGLKNRSSDASLNSFAPPPQTKRTPEQLAGMERFRELMEPVAALEKPVTPGRPTVVATARNPFLETLPNENSVAHTFTSPKPNLGKPSGLKPLSGITGPYPVPEASQAAQPQRPPWMSDSTAPISAPQRKF